MLLPRFGEPGFEFLLQFLGDLWMLLQHVVLLGEVGIDVEEFDGFAVLGEELPLPFAGNLGRVGFRLRVVALHAAVEPDLPEDGVALDGMRAIIER